MSRDDNFTNVILEDINGKFDALMEITEIMHSELKTKASQESVDSLQSDLNIVKAAVTDLTTQVDEHESRITTLETA